LDGLGRFDCGCFLLGGFVDPGFVSDLGRPWGLLEPFRVFAVDPVQALRSGVIDALIGTEVH